MKDWLLFFVIGWGAPFSLYVLVQVCAILTTRGRLRIVVATPLPLMICGAIYSAVSYMRDANLWPIPLIFGGAAGVVVTLILWIAALLLGRRQTHGAT